MSAPGNPMEHGSAAMPDPLNRLALALLPFVFGTRLWWAITWCSWVLGSEGPKFVKS